MKADWHLRACATACAVCGQAFPDRSPVVSALFFSPAAGYLRRDCCASCAANGPVPPPPPPAPGAPSPATPTLPGLVAPGWERVSSWTARYVAPPPPSAPALRRETVESLFRRFLASDAPADAPVLFLLAVMLERRRILVEKEVSPAPDGAVFRLYEHRKTLETFLVADPRLPVAAYEPHQRRLLDLLNPETEQTSSKMNLKTPLDFFRTFTPFYRPSKGEAAFARHVASLFSSLGATVQFDAAGNLRADLTPAGGAGALPRSLSPVILQAHLDMVVAVDPDASPAPNPAANGIELLEDPAAGTLRARGTSLGADDGIGIALALAIFADPPPNCPPLRAICTVDEETGMSGARALDPSWLADASLLLNLDWEDACQFCTGSSFSQTLTLSANLSPAPVPPNSVAYDLSLSGPSYPGGHSGVDIHLRPPHPGVDLAQALTLPDVLACRPALAAFRCGHASNAIPTSATAIVLVPADLAARFLDALPDPVADSATPAPLPADTATAEASVQFLSLLSRLPQGPLSADGPTVLASSNTGIAELSPASARLVLHPRAATPAALESIAQAARALALPPYALAASPAYPGWTLPSDSPTLARALDVAQAATGHTWTAAPTHAGLECGLFAEKAPNLPILSFGPTVQHPHTPGETLLLSTLPPTLSALRALLSSLP